MNKSGHLIVGYITGILFILIAHFAWNLFNIKDYKVWVTWMIIIFIYSLLADSDHKSGTITWVFFGTGVALLIYAYLYDNNVLMVSSIVLLSYTFIAAQWLPHRGPTHTLWFAALSGLPLYVMFDWQTTLLGIIVYYSHLLADGEPFKVF